MLCPLPVFLLILTAIRLSINAWRGLTQYGGRETPRTGFRRHKAPVTFIETPPTHPHRFRPKPDWAVREIIRLSALMPHEGGLKIANAFNRRFAESHGITVGKTWVCEKRRQHRYAILELKRKYKQQTPKNLPVNHTWAMDMTGLPDTSRQSHTVLGIIDHGSRGLICLRAMKSKASIALLRVLLEVIEQTGNTPQRLKTDNEAALTSRLFRFGLWWLGIRHERSQPGHPWQNGRIERLFGILKEKTKDLLFQEDSLQKQLQIFQWWYNHVRTHQNLHSKTPYEAWHALPVTCQTADGLEPKWCQAWNGRLAGYWFKPPPS